MAYYLNVERPRSAVSRVRTQIGYDYTWTIFDRLIVELMVSFCPFPPSICQIVLDSTAQMSLRGRSPGARRHGGPPMGRRRNGGRRRGTRRQLGRHPDASHLNSAQVTTKP